MKSNIDRKLPKQFSFAKDLSGRYLFACEVCAELAGIDSPAQMIGKRDSDMIWKGQAELFRKGDIQAFKGNLFLNQPEIVQVARDDQIHQLIVTKTALRNNQNQIVGVIGSALDITYHQILRSAGDFDSAGKRFIFNGDLSGVSLSKKQITILEYIVKGYSAADIAGLLNRSKRTIEGHVEHLKNKLQCSSKAEVIRWAVTAGLLHSVRQHS